MSKVTMLTNSDIRKVDLVPAGAQQLSKIEIMKSKEVAKMDESMNNLTDKDIEEIQELLDSLKEKLGIKDDEHEDKDDEISEVKEGSEPVYEKKEDTKTDDKPTNDESINTVKEDSEDVKMKQEESEEVKEALQKAANLEAENNKLKEEIAKAADEKEKTDFINKASVFKNIPGVNETDLGEVLRNIYKTAGKDTYDKLESILKSANDVIGSGSLFVEKGSSAAGSGDPADVDEAWSMIEALAQSRVQKGISNSTNCIAEALKTPEGERLYNKYKSLMGGN